ncbi:MAG: hypothetical protein ABSB33_03120, partial [Tepidisphaeraceae bacterium]
HESGSQARMECNLLPPDSFETAEKWLVDLASSRARASVAGAIAERMPSESPRQSSFTPASTRLLLAGNCLARLGDGSSAL